MLNSRMQYARNIKSGGERASKPPNLVANFLLYSTLPTRAVREGKGRKTFFLGARSHDVQVMQAKGDSVICVRIHLIVYLLATDLPSLVNSSLLRWSGVCRMMYRLTWPASCH